jgi:hypothetical protein
MKEIEITWNCFRVYCYMKESKKTVHSPTDIGIAFGKKRCSASSWACRYLKKLKELKLVRIQEKYGPWYGPWYVPVIDPSLFIFARFNTDKEFRKIQHESSR